jgi:hypothetical protein
LDDVQNWFVRLGQMAVMQVENPVLHSFHREQCANNLQTFITEGEPLSIGIIANAFAAASGTFPDADLVSFVLSAVDNVGVNWEIVSHGYNHEDFSTFDLANQTRLLQVISESCF